MLPHQLVQFQVRRAVARHRPLLLKPWNERPRLNSDLSDVEDVAIPNRQRHAPLVPHVICLGNIPKGFVQAGHTYLDLGVMTQRGGGQWLGAKMDSWEFFVE